MANFVPKRDGSPLNKPPSEKRVINNTSHIVDVDEKGNKSTREGGNIGFILCPFCAYKSKSLDAMEVHKSKYHEAILAKEGERARERGGIERRLDEQSRWHGDYIQCYVIDFGPPYKVTEVTKKV